ncbi:hypothetical protein [Lacticaseibacillus sharpeae]|uniref:hypothetical protein n=1 Tax=Lacticaseibacillus sharpeae TaxID=1626 RepID=UPI0006D24EE2|nr:hypothetical protein [Lacticaseibacillus sharpeae]
MTRYVAEHSVNAPSLALMQQVTMLSWTWLLRLVQLRKGRPLPQLVRLGVFRRYTVVRDEQSGVYVLKLKQLPVSATEREPEDTRTELDDRFLA